MSRGWRFPERSFSLSPPLGCVNHGSVADPVLQDENEIPGQLHFTDTPTMAEN